jgi:hypothetical protein
MATSERFAMADQLDPERSGSPDLLAPSSGGRETSGLQDILAVTNKLKERDDLGAIEGEPETSGDSGRIVFGSKDLNSATESDDSGLFVSFSGGLGAGLGAGEIAAPVADPDLATLGGEGAVRESQPVQPTARPAEEPKRNPLVAIAVVLGLCLAGGAAVVLTQDKNDPAPKQAQNDPEMSAKPEEPATVAGVAAEPEADKAGSAGGVPVEPEPEPDPVGETLGGETQGLLADGTFEEGDPLAQPGALLVDQGSGTTAVKKPTYGGGVSGSKQPSNTSGGAVEPAPEPEPEPEPVVDPLPEPKKTGGGTSAASQDEVDCLLNPDLPKCGQGGSSGSKDGPVLVPKVPEKLDSTALKSGFNTVKSKAKACGEKHGAVAGSKVKIHASIEGATGKVTHVEAKGEHAGTELGKCVEEAVKDATFDVFKSPAQGVDYSMVM